MNLLALGDGLSTGMTPYQVEGYNFNDYLRDDLHEQKQLEHYYKNFNEIDETAASLLTKINNNVENIDHKIKIKQAIKEADIITLALGMDELNNYAKKNTLGSTKINGFLKKYEDVLKEIRKLNDKKVYMLSLYPTHFINETKVKKINEQLSNLAKQYKIVFVDISNLYQHNDFFLNKKNYYINYKGQEFIFYKIKESSEISTMLLV